LHAHASRRTWSTPLRNITLGGARIEAPRRRGKNGEALSPRHALAEVVKYSIKPASLADVGDERVAEVIAATTHKRLIRCTGLLFGLAIHEDVDDEQEVRDPDLEGVDDMHVKDSSDLTVKVAVDEYGRTYAVTGDEVVWRDDEAANADWRARWLALARAHEERKRAEVTT
ncbi:MAG TPA: hypothetical protein VGO62_09735, partial [Myxococcota bacterium]